MLRKEIHTAVGKSKVIECDFGDKLPLINELEDFLNHLKKDGATHIRFSGESDYDSCDIIEVSFQGVNVCVETENEAKIRIEKYNASLTEKEDAENKRKAKAELTLYKKLHAKYGK